MESSRRDLSNHMAGHRSIMKNNQYTYYSRLMFSPETGERSLKQLFHFYSESNLRGCIVNSRKLMNGVTCLGGSHSWEMDKTGGGIKFKTWGHRHLWHASSEVPRPPLHWGCHGRGRKRAQQGAAQSREGKWGQMHGLQRPRRR